jgi:hypothetical protein
MFICSMRNDVRMAVESIAGNTNTLETALTAAVQYESALMAGGGGGQKQGGANAKANWQHCRSREMRMLLRKHLHLLPLQECKT